MSKKCINKNCIFFGLFQNLNNFHKWSLGKDGHKSECKNCRNKYQRELREKNPQYMKGYREEHKEQIKIKRKEYRQLHIEQICEYNKDYKKNNKEKIILHEKQRRQNDINFKIKKNLRCRLYCAIKNNQKSGSAVRDLGCSIDELKQRLSQMFYPHPKSGELMSWENYGRQGGKLGWDIDHIIPLSRFQLKDKKQQLEAIHYTNLQPMWAYENSSKGNRII